MAHPLPMRHKPKNEQHLQDINTKEESNNEERITRFKEKRTQVYDKDVLCEFDNSTNASFVHDPEAFVVIDSNETNENSSKE